uniref:hypothetical protein n=1 Tax=Fusobacterium mortiferum TaxID=850 RepID=UPI003FF13CF6
MDEFITKGLAKSKELDFNDEYEYVAHSLINLGISVQLYPIVLKSLELGEKERVEVLKGLEKLMLRHLIIKTRANLAERLNGNFKDSFNIEADNKTPIIKNIYNTTNKIKGVLNNTLLEEDKKYLGWYSYWNENIFLKELENGLT